MTYDDLATRLTAEYDLFLLALTGRYQQMRAPGVEVTPHAITGLRIDGYSLGNTFRVIADIEIDSYLRPTLEAASEGLAAQLEERKRVLKAQILEAVIQNVKQVSKLAISGIGGIAGMMHDTHGGMGKLIQRSVSQVEYKVSDASNRKWNASVLMKTIVRDFGYQSFIDRQAEYYANAGSDMMQTSKGQVFSLSGANGTPSLDEVRKSYFHPNSNSVMVPYVQTK